MSVLLFCLFLLSLRVLTAADDSKGTHSVYTKYDKFEVMFHVSTLLPYHPADPLKVPLGYSLSIRFFFFPSTPSMRDCTTAATLTCAACPDAAGAE
jgi:hypothetical protein